jgi:hypothetical protein
MSVRALLPASLLLFALSACAHTKPAAASTTMSCVTQPLTSTPSATPATTPAPTVTSKPDKLVWMLRSGESSAWTAVPATLHAFSTGRWECALGEVQTADAEPTRRLACTHASGATVQTRLVCRAANDASELELELDRSPALHLRCRPENESKQGS